MDCWFDFSRFIEVRFPFPAGIKKAPVSLETGACGLKTV